MKRLLPIGLELFGIAIIGCGIGIELMMRAHIGSVIITSGSCFVAIGAVIWGKFVRRERSGK